MALADAVQLVQVLVVAGVLGPGRCGEIGKDQVAAVDHGDGLGEPGMVAVGLQRIGRARRRRAAETGSDCGGLGRRDQDIDERGTDKGYARLGKRGADGGGDAEGVDEGGGKIGSEVNCSDHDGEHEDGAQRVLAATAAALGQRHEHDQVVLGNERLAPAAAQHRLGVAQTDRRMIELFDALFVEPLADRERLGDCDHLPVAFGAERVVQHDDGAGHQASPVKR